ncbi:YbaB/EbfC family nucleoid-associated protein [Streptosporangium canum]|uniref:YbaB/EbfC family nucleoid-associated protein n=1 Tax=Streptosporangium canum TaxID=324952 RepID=UPI003415AACA
MFDPTNFELEDLERFSRDAEQEMRRLAGIEGELREIHGTGTGADGLISVTANGSGQVKKIDLNPRVMRLDSHVLAAELMKAIDAARADGERKANELLSGAGISVDTPNLDELQERMTVTYEAFARSMDGLSRRLDRG